MINFTDYFSLPLLNHFYVWPSHSPLRKLLNILDKCSEPELTTLMQNSVSQPELCCSGDCQMRMRALMSMFGSYLSSEDIDCGQCINDMRIAGHHPPPSVTNDIFPPHYFDILIHVTYFWLQKPPSSRTIPSTKGLN